LARSKPEDFEYIARLKFASKLRYSTQHDAELLLEDNYFHNSSTQYLEIGDELDIVCFHDNGAWTKGLLEVVDKSKTMTKVALLGSWHKAGASSVRTMSSVHKGFGKWAVVDENGKEIAKDLTKDEASSMAGNKKRKQAA
jgi:uncharacterized protein (DUF2235 family)